MIDAISRIIVGAVRAGYRHKVWLSGIALGLTLTVAVAYVLVGALRVNPFSSTYPLTIELADSGGLLANQDVTVRGVAVGRVESLRLTPSGVTASVNIKSTIKIPANAPVRVSGLSAAGEQYIDFEPTSTDGPFLAGGDVIRQDQSTTPIPLYELLTNANGLLAQIDPPKLELIKKELSLSKDGPQKLTDLIDGGSFLLSTLNGVLPETVSVLRSSRVTLSLLADKNAGLAATAANLDNVLAGVNKMDGGYRTLVDQGPGLLSQVDALFDDNSDTMV
ncbi:MAG TPA: MlaD family protein, partial [Mycobacterium sp.]|nr:MlaD family protein [Mycobacterium sp.]